MVGDQAISTLDRDLIDEGGIIDSFNKKEYSRQDRDSGGSNPFARKPRLAITPPHKVRERANSLPGPPADIFSSVYGDNLAGGTEDEERAAKRKRINILPDIRVERADTMEMDAPKEQCASQLKGIIGKMCKQIKQLDKCIKETYNPKKEIKDIAGRLASKELKGWLEDAATRNKEDELKELMRSENQKLRKQIQYLETRQTTELEEPREIVNVIQCAECEKARMKVARKRILMQGEGYDSFKRVMEKAWEEEIFPRIQVQQGHIWEAPTKYELMLPCSRNRHKY